LVIDFEGLGFGCNCHASEIRDLFRSFKHGAAAGLVDAVFRAARIPLSTEFALGCESSSALFARAWFRLSGLLSFAGEARLGHVHASATGGFRTTLAAEGFSCVCISFPGPLVLDHFATGARVQRG
jgi:hypothetical protein